jgi:multiple sugar transport system permease protein
MDKISKFFKMIFNLIISIIMFLIEYIFDILKAIYRLVLKVLKGLQKTAIFIYKVIKAFIFLIIYIVQNPRDSIQKSKIYLVKLYKGILLSFKHPIKSLKSLGNYLNNNTVKGYLYILPALAIIFTFTFYPFISAFLMGFVKFTTNQTAEFQFTYYDWSIFEFIKRIFTFDREFFNILSFNNFIFVLKDKDFWKAMYNTTIIVVISVPLSIVISLAIAVGLNAVPKLKSLFQTVYFLPYVTAMVAVATVWRWFFYKDSLGSSHGLINYMLGIFNISPIDWLYGSDGGYYQLLAFIIYSTWSALAFKIVIFLSGLQNINKEYYSAAKVDGASKWRIFTKITVPQLSPIILFVSITSMIGAFKVFTAVQTLFYGPGIDNSVLTIVFYVYREMSLSFYDTAAAAAVILFIFILLLTMLQFRLTRNKVHY